MKVLFSALGYVEKGSKAADGPLATWNFLFLSLA